MCCCRWFLPARPAYGLMFTGAENESATAKAAAYRLASLFACPSGKRLRGVRILHGLLPKSSKLWALRCTAILAKNRGGGEIEMRRREGRYRYSCRYRCHSIDLNRETGLTAPMTAERMQAADMMVNTCIAAGRGAVAIAAAEFLTARSALFFSLLRNLAMAPER